MVDLRYRVLPELRLGNPRSEVTGERSHVAVQQLVPRFGEGLGQLLGVVEPALSDLAVDRVLPQRDDGDQHRRGAARPAERIGDRAGTRAVLGGELPRSGRAFGQLPLVAVQVLQVAVAPLGRCRGPDHLQSAGDGVLALSAAVGALPAQPLLFDRGAFGLRTDQISVARAVGLAEAVPADDQCGGLLVVHRHPAERLADVHRGRHRVWFSFGPFGIDVDQTHRGRAVRLREVALAGVALVGAQPFTLFAEEDFLWLPDVFATETEPKGLEPHRFQGYVAGEYQQVCPRELAAVLLLDRPQQPARLVQAGVVRPAVQRGESLHALTAATAAVIDPVGACGVPTHPDEKTAVVAVVGGPPVLRSGHHRYQVHLECVDVELGELFGVVEVLTKRVRFCHLRMQPRHVDLIGPPVLVPQGSVRLWFGRVDYRIFAFAALVGCIG